MMSRVNIGLVGLGRWGIRYVETLKDIKRVNLKWVCSKTEKTIKSLHYHLPRGVKTTTDIREILQDGAVSVVIIASSGSTHYSIAKSALRHDKHVLVEKPVTFSWRQIKDLVELSRKKGKILMAGHIHCYNPGITRLERDIRKGIFGKLRFMHFVHTNSGPQREDMGVVLDFLPHTLSILSFLTKRVPISVQTSGASYSKHGFEDVATLSLKYKDGFFVTAMSSWRYPEKQMKVVVVGEKRFAFFDDYAKKGKLNYLWKMGKRMKTKVQKLPSRRPLKIEVEHFLDCVSSGKEPLTGKNHALGVSRVLDAVQLSLKTGRLVKL
jgi:UDP-2-acetamido-3-amino-2,3-dideoxy-glucuronate N-acetyltransferase